MGSDKREEGGVSNLAERIKQELRDRAYKRINEQGETPERSQVDSLTDEWTREMAEWLVQEFFDNR